jgi:hypothetical protein
MRHEQILVLLLFILLPLSGCLETQDDSSEENEEQSQTNKWYSSGGTFTSWNDENSYDNGNENFLWPDENQANGGYSNLTDWNLTECESQNGTAYLLRENSPPRDQIYCEVTFAQINTSSGEALLIYEARNLAIETICDNVTISSPNSIVGEYNIVTGSSMDCQHRLYRTLSYSSDDSVTFWSIVYAIQETTVV